MVTLNLSAATDYAQWDEHGAPRVAVWSAANTGPAPKRLITADDTLGADTAYRLISQGTALIWRGDYQNGKQLLHALARRIDKKETANKKRKHAAAAAAGTANTLPAQVFNQYRQQQSQRASLLNRLVIELDANYAIALRRAPDVHEACQTALGAATEPMLISLRALQGLISAHEWRRTGVAIPGLPDRLHVHYGVFSPVRGEYIDLVGQAPLPTAELAFDIGTGSGVLAAVLAHRGMKKIIATDVNDRALACAAENFQRLGLLGRIELQKVSLFPEGKAELIVCNPPWLPARPTTSLEQAIYDPDHRMLLGFLNGLHQHLEPNGEAWLIMSDLAEHLGLRSPDFLADAIAKAGLQVLGRLDTRPRHGKAQDPNDPLHNARRAELTTLWRLGLAPTGTVNSDLT